MCERTLTVGIRRDGDQAGEFSSDLSLSEKNYITVSWVEAILYVH